MTTQHSDVTLALPSKVSPGAALWRRVELFPGVFNSLQGLEGEKFDKLITNILVEAHNAMKDRAMGERDNSLSPERPYGGNISRLSVRAGSFYSPCGVQPAAQEDETAPPSEWQHELLGRLASWATGHREAVSIDLNSISTYGFPSWTSDASDKRALFDLMLRNPDHYLRAIEKGDTRTLYDEYGIVHAFHQTYRIQPDVSEIEVTDKGFRRIKSKAREVDTFDGDHVVADKTIPSSDLEANRIRLATALGGGANQGARMIERAISNYQDRGAAVFKHRGGDDVCAKLRGCFDAVSVDYSSFDQSVQQWAIRTVVDNMGLTDIGKAAALASLNGPICVFGDSPKTKGKKRLAGNPFDWSELQRRPHVAGIASGHGWVSFLGKIIGFHQLLVTLVESKFLPSNIDALSAHVGELLNGTHPYLMVVNQGDDNMVGFKRPGDADIYRKWLASNGVSCSSLMVKVSEEKPRAFLGTCYFISDPDALTWGHMPRIESFLVNQLVAERSVGGVFRPMWAIGFREERKVYGLNPMYDMISPIRDRAFREVYGINFDKVVKNAYAAQLRALIAENASLADLSPDELEFIENPDRRHYGRVNMANVRKEIQDVFLKNVPPDAWEHMIDYYYDGGATHYTFPTGVI